MRQVKARNEEDMNILLISLHPRHSQNVFDNKKTIELRKRGVREENRQPAFNRILIYETSPTAEIVGYCEPVEILWKDAQTFCNNYKNSLCLTSREIWDYLGDRMGYGIRIRNPQKITPIPLAQMREVGILPPQGYRYLSDKDIKSLGVVW
jgi:predicted transcriptional regulator